MKKIKNQEACRDMEPESIPMDVIPVSSQDGVMVEDIVFPSTSRTPVDVFSALTLKQKKENQSIGSATTERLHFSK